MENTTEQKENCDMNTSTPVLPLVANGVGHYDHHHGLEGKDAVLIHSNQTSLNAHLLNESVSRNSKSDVVETLNAKFEAERSARDMEVRLSEMIRSEADKTRTRMFEFDVQRAERDRVDGKFLALEKLISAITPSA